MPDAEPVSLSPLDRLLAERACERLIAAFVRELDLGHPAAVADLCTADGVWEWPGGDRGVEGREALRACFGARPADRLSRHVSTNVLVTLLSPTTAGATSYFTTYRVDGHEGGMASPRAPVRVGQHYEDTDTFRRVDGRWALATRTVFLAFAGPTERLAPADRLAPAERAVPPGRP
ncbi:nuclear transport factor 2 family protein [Streptomyces sp. AC563]|uniref:nuclear transport factor 2 family protein n=1 Tax=Streptomyces buecherae TaxID=2763006 RepID=UPI00164E77FC|nr:nuclear transport factor 2 family protein [Streptomyces buecherae]MBC3988244.1 nuclear transport factor 2 family protein [Streptomyces buecherae]